MKGLLKTKFVKNEETCVPKIGIHRSILMPYIIMHRGLEILF